MTETVHLLPAPMREKLANLNATEREAVDAAISRVSAPYATARQSLLEGYCAGAGIDLDSQTHDWRLSADNAQLEPIEKPKPNRETRRQKRKAS